MDSRNLNTNNNSASEEDEVHSDNDEGDDEVPNEVTIDTLHEKVLYCMQTLGYHVDSDGGFVLAHVV